MTILSTFLNELFPFARLLLVNRRVAARLADETPDPRQARWAGLGREKLLALLAEEWDRAKALDEKLFKQTAALSLAVTAAGVASKGVLDALPSGALKATVLSIILYAILSLFGGVLIGFSGVRPKARAGYGPDFALLVRYDNKAAGAVLADALMHFEITNTLRANEASAANMVIRNGVVAFALAMTFSLFLPPKASEPTSMPADSRSYMIIQNQAPTAPPAGSGEAPSAVARDYNSDASKPAKDRP